MATSVATKAVPVADIPATRQWPETGRTLLLHSTRFTGGPIPAKVIRVVPSAGRHPVVNVHYFGDGRGGAPVGCGVAYEVALFDPLGGRVPALEDTWCEWMTFQAEQHAARTLPEKVTGPDARD